MAIEITCPRCGETERLRGARAGGVIELTCEVCATTWTRDPTPACPSCGSDDLQSVPLAIVEKSRGTQLSVVGIRMLTCCRACDGDVIRRWQRNRPNPLMPDELPTVDPSDASS